MHLAGSLRSEKTVSGALEHLPRKQDFMILFSSFPSMSESTDKPGNALALFTGQLETLVTHQGLNT